MTEQQKKLRAVCNEVSKYLTEAGCKAHLSVIFEGATAIDREDFRVGITDMEAIGVLRTALLFEEQDYMKNVTVVKEEFDEQPE